jgi:DNA-3-methyladenine glycosylase II
MEPVRKLQCGFLRGTRSCDLRTNAVRLAFPLDGSFGVVGVELAWDGQRIRGDVFGAGEVDQAKHQVARTLAVDRDATPFHRLLREDPALRRVAEARPGFRPVVAPSAYVMAGWCVLSQRLRMSQAAAIQIRIAEAAGDVVDVCGESVASFPRPQSLLSLSGFRGVSAEKWVRLQAIARAALEGKLDTERLLAMPYEEARGMLMGIRGVGSWTADGILIRGCGPIDVLPIRERTLHGAVALTYGLGRLPDDEKVSTIAAKWRPFRTWVSVMLIAQHFDAARKLVAPNVGAPNSARL